MSSIGFVAVCSLIAGPLAGAAQTPDCAGVTSWSYTNSAGYTFYLVVTGGGWVWSYASGGSSPFATASVSVSGASFSSDAVYNGAQTGYIAYESGTFADDCSIGITTPLGQWHDNNGQRGTFQMTALSGSTTTTTSTTSTTTTSTTTTSGAKLVGHVVGIKGNGIAYIRHDDGSVTKIRVGSMLYERDVIVTNGNSKVAIEFIIGGRAGINDNSTVIIATDRSVSDVDPPVERLILRKMGMWEKTAKLKEPLEIQTSGGVIGIKG